MQHCDPQRAQTVFLAAIEIADVDARRRFVDRECDDESLRLRVHALLGAHDGYVGVLDDGDQSSHHSIPAAWLMPDEQPGSILAGRYRLLHPVAEGGMGSVWVAEQGEPIRRTVAVKLVKPGLDSRQILARFDVERQALAMMDHPHIAKVYDGGVTEHGRSFFVMEYVNGVPLNQYCDNARLPIRERLELFVPVCRAVQHAHQKGIIHRDLKPSNILVCDHDGKPIPKVIDFGLAKATQDPLTERTLLTAHGLLLGTPLYMSPEQAEFNNADIDTRTDIYSLGAILYELLSGTTPVEKHRFEEVGLSEMLRWIKETDPPPPSSRLRGSAQRATIAEQRSARLEHLPGMLAGDLDWIVMKALDKDRNRRYPTANSLARDVERYLNDEAVDASPPSALYRCRKFLRKHQAICVTAGVFALLLLASTAWSIWLAVRAERSARAEAKQRSIAEAAEQQMLAAYRANTDDVIQQLIGSKPQLGLAERTYLENARQRWQELAARQGTDVHSLAIRGEGRYRVALLLQKLDRLTEAIPEYEAARAVQSALVEQFPSSREYRYALAITENNLAAALAAQGLNEEAQSYYQTSCDLWKNLVHEAPQQAEYRRMLANAHHNRGLLLVEQGDYPTAQRELQQAYDLRQKLTQEQPALPALQQEWANTLDCQGALLGQLGQPEAALAAYRAAQSIHSELVKQYPNYPEFQHDLANSCANLGGRLRESGQYDDARNVCQEACDLLSQLVQRFPSVPEYRQDWASARNNLAMTFVRLGLPQDAIAEYRAARDLLARLVEESPQLPAQRRKLATVHCNLGTLLESTGASQEASDAYQAAGVLLEQLAADHPDVPRYQTGLAGVYCNAGLLELEGGAPAQGLAWFDKAVQLLQAVHAQRPEWTKAREFLRNSYYGRAMAHDELHAYESALSDWNQVVDLSPPSEHIYYRPRRAITRLRTGDVAAALAEIDETATMLDDADGEALSLLRSRLWFDCARGYAMASSRSPDHQRQYLQQALAALNQAVQSGYDDVESLLNDDDLALLSGQADFQAIVQSLSAATKTDEPQSTASDQPSESLSSPRNAQPLPESE